MSSEIRDLHKSRYTQAIPGENRIDDEHKLTSAETSLRHFGDDLPLPARLLSDAANAHQRGRHVTACFQSMNAVGEGRVAEAFRRRDAKVQQWIALLNAEVDSLARELTAVSGSECDEDRTRRHLAEVSRATEETADYRTRIPDKMPDDAIDRLLKEEKNATDKAYEISQQNSQDLKDCRSQLESCRLGLMSEVEAKALSLSVSRRAQSAEALLSFPYQPRDHPVDQLYHPNTEDDWERSLETKLRRASAARHASSSSRLRAASARGAAAGAVADAWAATTRALQEEVRRDERALQETRNTLEELGRELLWTREREASLRVDLQLEERGKERQLWRLQTLTYRPASDHIRDGPATSCDEELLDAEKRAAFASSSVARSRELLGRLQHEKDRQTLAMEKIAKKLHIERENCLGLRRTVQVEGRGHEE